MAHPWPPGQLSNDKVEGQSPSIGVHFLNQYTAVHYTEMYFVVFYSENWQAETSFLCCIKKLTFHSLVKTVTKGFWAKQKHTTKCVCFARWLFLTYREQIRGSRLEQWFSNVRFRIT